MLKHLPIWLLVSVACGDSTSPPAIEPKIVELTAAAVGPRTDGTTDAEGCTHLASGIDGITPWRRCEVLLRFRTDSATTDIRIDDSMELFGGQARSFSVVTGSDGWGEAVVAYPRDGPIEVLVVCVRSCQLVGRAPIYERSLHDAWEVSLDGPPLVFTKFSYSGR